MPSLHRPGLMQGDYESVWKLDRWAVDSKMIIVDGVPVNRVQVWPGRVLSSGGEKIQLDIREPPRRNPDGTYADYGVWTMVMPFVKARMEGNVVAEYVPGGHLAVAVDRDESGAAVIRFHHAEHVRSERKGILVTNGTEGAGWIVYGEPDRCWCPLGDCPCDVTYVEATYAFDEDTLTMKKGDGPPLTFDRNDVVDVLDLAVLYVAETGEELDDLERTTLSVRRPAPKSDLGWATAHGIGFESGGPAVPGEPLVCEEAPLQYVEGRRVQ